MKQFFTFARAWPLLGLWLVVAVGAQAQAPAWQSALAVSSSEYQVAATTTDASGNVYLVGSFEGTIALGSTTLTSVGLEDVAVAKWNPGTASIVWAQQIGGSGHEQATGIAVSGTSVYVAGHFTSMTTTLGSITLTNATTASAANGRADVFVAKITDTGSSSSVAWARRAGGSESDKAAAIAVSGSNVYVAGHFFSPTIDFDNVRLTNRGGTLTNDGFVAKLTDAGPSASFAWTQQIGGGDADAALGLAVSSPSVYVAGKFVGTATLGSLSLSSAGNTDLFVAKLTDAGLGSSFDWAQRAGGSSADEATGIVVEGARVYLAGTATGPVSFGTVSLAGGTYALPFLARLTDAGAGSSFTWARAGGPQSLNNAGGSTGLAVRGNSLYLTGGYWGTQYFDNIALTNPTQDISANVYVAKLLDSGSAGTFNWAQQAGGIGNDQSAGVLVTATGTVYVVGFVLSPATFGSLAVPASSTFIASLADVTLTASKPGLLATGLNLYPNPAHGRAGIELPAVPGAATATVTLLDALARPLRTQPAALNARTALDLTGLAPGLYAVRVQAGAATATQRLVVE